jgi:hypothetical protein
MALLECPTRTDLPTYKYVIELDGTNYQLEFTFNPRVNNDEGRWFVSLSDQTGALLIAAVPVRATWPLFDRFKGRGGPPGTLFAFDTTGNNEDPGRFDLGDRVRLLYLEVGT